MNRLRYARMAVGLAMAAAMTVAYGMAVTTGPVPGAEAATYGELKRKQTNKYNLDAQLAGVNSSLANQIKELEDLSTNRIPAAQQAANDAQQQAIQAKDAADAANERLEAARKDQEDLEAQIARTGADYDDARAAVAEMARDSFHTSDTTQLMGIITNSTSTEDFVGKMQADAAVARSKANAANSAAVELNTSMNRRQRLAAIKDQVAQLKSQADAQDAQARQVAADAPAKQPELAALQEQGNQRRAELESRRGELTTAAAREAADIVRIQSELASQAQNNTVNAGVNTSGDYNGPSTGGSSSGGSATSAGGGSSGASSGGASSGGAPAGGGSSGGASGMNYAVPGSCPAGSGFCYGHSTGNTVGGSAYPARQCTLWAYQRRSALSLPVGSYMGNGGDWDNTARGLGYLVNGTPHVGAVMVFERGQRVSSWTASALYGHVAVVEKVLGDGSVLISEGGTGFAVQGTTEIVSAAGRSFIHY